MLYEIFHPVDDSINVECAPLHCTYKKVATIEAPTMHMAFVQAQKDYDVYKALGIRSTCVGDLIRTHISVHIVKNVGFKMVNVHEYPIDAEMSPYDREKLVSEKREVYA